MGFSILMVILMFLWRTQIAISTVVNIDSASGNTPILFNCSTANGNHTWTYAADGVSKIVLSETGATYSLIVNTAGGVYTCNSSDGSIAQYTATNLLIPTIPHHGQSITFTEGSVNKSLSCVSNSYPNPTFMWTRIVDSTTTVENLQGKSNYLIANDGKGTSILTIRKVNLKSYGTYNCTVVNSLFGTTQTKEVLVRVHSRLAFLWPLLGILAEIVVVLCIILVVRRQAQLNADKEAAGLLTPTASTSNSEVNEAQGVRQRNIRM